MDFLPISHSVVNSVSCRFYRRDVEGHYRERIAVPILQDCKIGKTTPRSEPGMASELPKGAYRAAMRA